MLYMSNFYFEDFASVKVVYVAKLQTQFEITINLFCKWYIVAFHQFFGGLYATMTHKYDGMTAEKWLHPGNVQFYCPIV